MHIKPNYFGRKSFAHRRTDHVLALIYADPYIFCSRDGICLIPWLSPCDMQFFTVLPSDFQNPGAIQHGENGKQDVLSCACSWQCSYVIFQQYEKRLHIIMTATCSCNSCKVTNNFSLVFHNLDMTSFQSNFNLFSFFIICSVSTP